MAIRDLVSGLVNERHSKLHAFKTKHGFSCTDSCLDCEVVSKPIWRYAGKNYCILWKVIHRCNRPRAGFELGGHVKFVDIAWGDTN